MESFKNEDGGVVVYKLIKIIQENKIVLSEIDGAIGDGDHGINMNKGFTMCEAKLGNEKVDLHTALKTLGRILLTEIGGSMGPIYGTFFREMAKACAKKDDIDAAVFAEMLENAAEGVAELAGAKIGDKTLYDCIKPAADTFKGEIESGADFIKALDAMSASARKGCNSTIDLVAKLGRSARLGERSRGIVDAGAASCCLILETMSQECKKLLK